MSLTELSYYIRRFSPIVILGAILFFLLFLILKLALQTITSRPVVKPFVPTFGQLDPIEFSVKVDYPPNPQFVIDNIEGRPITSTASANIFYIPEAPTRFGYVQNITLMAKALGFDTEIDKYTLETTQATFQNLKQTLTIDIRNFNFTFESDYTQEPELFANPLIPVEDAIIEDAKEFLRRMDRYPEELAQGSTHVIYLHFEPGNKEFTVVDTPQEANVVEVDFFLKDINGLPAVAPKYFNSQNYVVMAFSPEGRSGYTNRIIKAQIQHFPSEVVGYQYPVKSGDIAWKELQEGKAAIVSAGVNSNKITIRQMFLAYYISDTYQQYLQPVYVFLGDNNFAAYVQAVDNMYIKGYIPPPTESR